MVFSLHPRDHVSNKTASSDLIEPVLAALSLVFVVAVQHSYQTSPWAWTTAVLIHLAAAGSGRWPLAAATVALLAVGAEQQIPAEQTTTASLALLINAASATARQPRFGVSISVFMVAGSFVGLVLHLDNYAPTFRSSTPFAIAAMVAVGVGLLWRVTADRLSHQRDEALAHVEELRLELARELHDTVAQSLSHAAMRAWMAAERDDVPPSTRDDLVHIAKACGSSAADLRQLLSTLRSGSAWITPEHGPLADADTLTATVEKYARRLGDHGFLVHTDIRLGVVSAALSLTLAKIVREVTNNIIKHARPGSTCWLSLHDEGGTLHGVFVNHALSPRAVRRGLGLIGIEERLRLLNGTCTVSLVNGQWRIHVMLPSGCPGSSDPPHA